MKQKHEITNEMYSLVATKWLQGNTNQKIHEALKEEIEFEYSISKISQMIKEMKTQEIEFHVSTELESLLVDGKLPEKKPSIKKTNSKTKKEKMETEQDVQQTESTIEDYENLHNVKVHTYEEVEKMDYEDANLY